MLESLYEAATANDADICGGTILIYNVEEYSDPETHITQLGQNVTIFAKDYTSFGGFYKNIYKRTLLISNEVDFPPYRRFQDPVFFLKALVAAGQIFCVGRPTYAYRRACKKVIWNEVKINDLMRGVLDCLEIADKNGYEANFRNLVNTCKKGFRGIEGLLISKGSEFRVSDELKGLIEECNRIIDAHYS